jgi:hypothetical protein
MCAAANAGVASSEICSCAFWGAKTVRPRVDPLEYLTELVADKDTTIRHLRQLLLPASTDKTRDVLAKAGAAAANPVTHPLRLLEWSPLYRSPWPVSC